VQLTLPGLLLGLTSTQVGICTEGLGWLTGLGLLWQDRACPYLTLAGVQKDANSASGRHHRDTDPSAQVVAREFPQVAHDVIFKFGVDCNCITRLSARLFSDSPRQSVH